MYLGPLIGVETASSHPEVHRRTIQYKPRGDQLDGCLGNWVGMNAIKNESSQ